MVSAQFQLRMDICEMLRQKYLGENHLSFPVSSSHSLLKILE